LCAPDKPNTKTFDELKEFLTGLLKPKPLIIAERRNSLLSRSAVSIPTAISNAFFSVKSLSDNNFLCIVFE
jgi:hypothetical protein